MRFAIKSCSDVLVYLRVVVSLSLYGVGRITVEAVVHVRSRRYNREPKTLPSH